MRTFLKLIVYNTLVLMALFLILEIVVRTLGIHSPNNFVEEVNDYGEIINYHRPNSRYNHNIEQKNLVVFNNMGFHDLPHETDDKSKPNVAYFGDSFVESLQIPTEQVFTSQVAVACADSIEVFNFGMSGTGIANQFRLYQRLLSSGKTFDFVYVVFFPGNDFYDNNPRIPIHPNYTLVIDNTGAIRQINRKVYSPAQRVVKSLRSISALINWIYESLFRSKRRIIKQQAQMDATSRMTDIDGRDAGKRYPSVAPEALKPVATAAPAKDHFDTAMISGLTRIIDKWSGDVGKTRFRMMIIDQARYLRSSVNLKVFLDSLHSIDIDTVPIDIPKEGHFLNYGHFNEAGHRLWTELALKDLKQIRLR